MATRGVKITGLNDLSNVALTGNIIIPVVDPTITLASPDGETLQANLYQLGNYILNEAGNLFPKARVANTVSNNAQPNITSVGTLTSLNVTGNTSIGYNLNVAADINSPATLTINNITANSITAGAIIANVVTAKLANGSSNINIATANGAVTVSVSGNANIATFSGTGFTIAGDLTVQDTSYLGDVSKVKIYGGANRSVLVTDGLGNLSWGPDIIAAGPNTAVQFNDAGNFGGSGNFTFNKNTSTLAVNNAEISDTLRFPGYAGGAVSFIAANTSNNVGFIVPDTIGTSQQVLGIVDQDTQKMGWKTVPVYYINVGLRSGGTYLSSPDAVLRVYPVRQRDGSYLNVNTTV